MAAPMTSVRSIRLPDDLWDQLGAEAEARGLTVNALVRERIERRGGPGQVTVSDDPLPRPPATVAARVSAKDKPGRTSMFGSRLDKTYLKGKAAR